VLSCKFLKLLKNWSFEIFDLPINAVIGLIQTFILHFKAMALLSLCLIGYLAESLQILNWHHLERLVVNLSYRTASLL